MVGSNIKNILLILGVSATVNKEGLVVDNEFLALDIPFMVFISLLSLPLFVSGAKLNRFEGALLIAFYIGYCTYLLGFLS